MKIKKLKIKEIVTIVVSLMVIAVLCIVIAKTFETKSAILSINSMGGKQGGEVTLNLVLANNPGIVGLSAIVDYNMEAFELIGVEGTDDVFPTDVLISSNNINTVPYTLSWEDGLNPNKTENGTLAKLTFKIKDNAPVGKYDVQILAGDFYNFDLEDCAVITKSGTITVSK